MHIAQEQIRKLGSYALSRDGQLVPAAGAAAAQACWNFALSGTNFAVTDHRAPDAIIDNILEIDKRDATDQAVQRVRPDVEEFYPNWEPHLTTIKNNFANARNGQAGAQAACRRALLSIMAIENGLTVCANDKYRLHMKSQRWFGWDHFALSVRAEQAGRPRIFVQTVTGNPLKHACTCIWDEHLGEATVDVQELTAQQVGFINGVQTYGKLCVDCGVAHGWVPSNPFNAWHRCSNGACTAVYCPTHGATLAGKRTMDRTRDCSRPGCAGRTTIVSSP